MEVPRLPLFETIWRASGSKAARAVAVVVGLLALTSCPGPMQSVHQVFYRSNGATAGTAPEDFTAWASGALVVVLGNSGGMAKDDLVFAGWNTKPDGTGDFYPVGSQLTIAGESITLYAVWKARSASSDLQLNELVSSWGEGTPIALELWNPTSQAVNLAEYQLRTRARLSNGTAADAGLATFDLPSLVVPAKGYVAIRSALSADFVSGGSTVYLDAASPSGTVVPWFSGSSDSVELLHGGVTADFVRWGSSVVQPSSTSFVFDGVAPGFGNAGQALSRDASGQFTPTSSDWAVHLWNTLGGPNDVSSDTDTDGDGLPDSAEIAGGTLAGVPLSTWGARPDRVDLFVHVDYMNKAGAPAAAIPQKAALRKVVDLFATHNIAVHFDAGTLFSASFNPAEFNLDERSHELPWSDSLSIGVQSGKANANELKAVSMPLAKNRSFFYLVFGNSQDYAADVANNTGGSGGLAYVWGNLSVVTLGTWELAGPLGTLELVNDQAATIVHELGHNLGLRHGGFEDLNFKPNYLSMMNYLYAYAGIPAVGNEASRYYAQFNGGTGTSHYSSRENPAGWTSDGITTSGYRVDLSDGTSSDLNEAAIDESLGIGRAGSDAVDFNDSGAANESSAINILQFLNPLATPWPAGQVLRDYSDWDHLDAVFQRSYSGLYGDSWKGVDGVPWSRPPTVEDVLTRIPRETSADTGLRRR